MKSRDFVILLLQLNKLANFKSEKISRSQIECSTTFYFDILFYIFLFHNTAYAKFNLSSWTYYFNVYFCREGKKQQVEAEGLKMSTLNVAAVNIVYTSNTIIVDGSFHAPSGTFQFQTLILQWFTLWNSFQILYNWPHEKNYCIEKNGVYEYWEEWKFLDYDAVEVFTWFFIVLAVLIIEIYSFYGSSLMWPHDFYVWYYLLWRWH